MLPGLLPGADRDLVAPLAKRLEKLFASIMLNTKVVEMKDDGRRNPREASKARTSSKPEQTFDRVLVSVGRKPNSADLGLETTKVQIDAKGFIKVDGQRRTAEPSIFAIGDVAGEPMLAHKATHEGRVAVEAISGKKSVFEPRAIPAVVFTDPEIAWCGLTETQAERDKHSGQDVAVPLGRVRPLHDAGPRPTASRSWSSIPRRNACSASASPAPARAN